MFLLDNFSVHFEVNFAKRQKQPQKVVYGCLDQNWLKSVYAGFPD